MSQAERTLLIRHLSSSLDDSQKTDLLKHFGASHVKTMGHRGPMKHTAFAIFNDQESAQRAVDRLHQLEVCGSRLIVEFARKSQAQLFPHEGDITDTKIKTENETKPEEERLMSESRVKSVQDEIFTKFGIEYPRHPGLFYTYPPPTVSTLTNIANALAAHPKFYVQVLHLMNKMNLPSPFGIATPTPPIMDESQLTPTADVEMQDVTSSEGSEIESDTEKRSKTKTLKRPLRMSKKSTKRPKFIPPPLPAPIREPSYISHAPQDVFDTSDGGLQKKISLNLPPAVAVSGSGDDLIVPETPKETDITQMDEVGGFGKIEPQKQDESDSSGDSDREVTINPSHFLSLSYIKANRISTAQMYEFGAFKNYSAGDPSSRIYVKNLSKKATEEDLVNLFGSFADYETEKGQNMFYIQMMEGRMKGQAFVTLMSDVQAKAAVKHVHGYVLHGKPIVVQFARTAKPKDTPTGKK